MASCSMCSSTATMQIVVRKQDNPHWLPAILSCDLHFPIQLTTAQKGSSVLYTAGISGNIVPGTSTSSGLTPKPRIPIDGYEE